MKFEKKKSQPKPKSHKGYSKEYPMFAFRVPRTATAKAKIDRVKSNLETIYQTLFDRREEDQKVINRNDILLEALDKGLLLIKREESI